MLSFGLCFGIHIGFEIWPSLFFRKDGQSNLDVS